MTEEKMWEEIWLLTKENKVLKEELAKHTREETVPIENRTWGPRPGVH